MRIDVPQFSLDIPEGSGWPALGVAGAAAYAAAGSLFAGAWHRHGGKRGRFDADDVLSGAIWPVVAVAVLVGLLAVALSRPAGLALRVGTWPFRALARLGAGTSWQP